MLAYHAPKNRSLLTAHNIPFREAHHEPTRTSEESARARGEEMRIGGKALLLKVDDTFRLFILSADRKTGFGAIKRHFSAKRTRFATPEELLSMTGLVPGSVPPFGEPILPFPLNIDPSVFGNEKIAFNAGSADGFDDPRGERLQNADQSRSVRVFDFVRSLRAAPSRADTGPQPAMVISNGAGTLKTGLTHFIKAGHDHETADSRGGRSSWAPAIRAVRYPLSAAAAIVKPAARSRPPAGIRRKEPMNSAKPTNIPRRGRTIFNGRPRSGWPPARVRLRSTCPDRRSPCSAACVGGCCRCAGRRF